MGCGFSNPASLHPTAGAAPLAAASSRPSASPTVHPQYTTGASLSAHRSPPSAAPARGSSDSSLSDLEEQQRVSPRDGADSAHPHAVAAIETAVTSPPAAALPASAAWSRSNPSPLLTPSAKQLRSHDSIPTRPPSLSLSPTTAAPAAPPRHGTPPARQSLPLTAFPMTEEAKAKIDRQLKRHTRNSSSSMSVSSSSGASSSPTVSTGPTPAPLSIRPSLSHAVAPASPKAFPASPSRSQRFAVRQQQVPELEADGPESQLYQQQQQQQHQHAASSSSPRSALRTGSARPSSSSVAMDGAEAARLRLKRSMSKHKFFDIDLPAETAGGVSTTAGNTSNDDSDGEREAARDAQRPSASVAAVSSLVQRHSSAGGDGVSVHAAAPAARRSHALSVDSGESSEEDSRQQRSSSRGRDRIHLRHTSRDAQSFETIQREAAGQQRGSTDSMEGVDIDAAVAYGRRSGPSTRHSSRRFTRSRRSNALEADAGSRTRVRMYDSRGHTADAAADAESPVVTADDGEGGGKPAVEEENKSSNGQQPPSSQQAAFAISPALSSSSSSDDSITPVRLPRPHQRAPPFASNAALSVVKPTRMRHHSRPSFDTAATAEHARGASSSVPEIPISAVVAAASAPAASVSVHHATNERLTSRKDSGLVVSSSPVTCSLQSVALHKLGYAVTLAAGLQQAVEQAGGRSFRLVLLDWEEDGSAAKDVLRWLRETEESRGDSRPLVIATGGGEDQQVVGQCEAAGCDGYVESGAQLTVALPDALQRCDAAAVFVHVSSSGHTTSRRLQQQQALLQ